MPLLTNTHVKYLIEALKKAFPSPNPGTMSYIRCFPPETIAELTAHSEFKIPNWDIYSVGKTTVGCAIQADRAVDLRENKEGAILLLVDSREAGTGMDGIYSAVQEVTEKELFSKSKELLLKAIEHKSKPARDFAIKAVNIAKKVGTGLSITPWQEFDFYATCLNSNLNSLGESVGLLGLWGFEGNDQEHLTGSRKMVETLLLPRTLTQSIGSRIDSLLLKEDQAYTRRALEEFLRQNESKSLWETVHLIKANSDFWLTSINPGFLKGELTEIIIEPWLGKTGKPLVPSGLKQGENAELTLFLPENSDQPGSKTSPKLEVKWKSLPSDLKPGSVRYIVSIISGSSELVAKDCIQTASAVQKCIFSYDDFRELIEDNRNGVWEANVVVRSENALEPVEDRENNLWKKSVDFFIRAGESGTGSASSSAGKRVRSLVEEAIRHNRDNFDKIVKTPAVMDKKNFVGAKVPGVSGTGTVYRPPLIKKIEENWQDRNFEVGRWRIKVRMDGSATSEPDFVKILETECDPSCWKQLLDQQRRMGKNAMERCGFIGMIYNENSIATDYVNAWGNALNSDKSLPSLALAHTLEIQALDGKTEGLIVLPGHPLRVAWHQAYDALASHIRYEEELPVMKSLALLRQLDGSFMPAFLPGIDEISGFVFGDTLGFHCTAMLRAEEKEPQATLSMLAKCLSPTDEIFTGAVGKTTSEAIGTEIRKYSEIHPEYSLLTIHALRPGNGMTISRALGYALKSKNKNQNDEESEDEDQLEISSKLKGFCLELFPGEKKHFAGLGRFLNDVTEQRRTVGALASNQDNWMTDSKQSEGLSIPRLRWSKRQTWEVEDPETAHISVAYDTFDSLLTSVSASDFDEVRPIEAYGLCPSLSRSFTFTPIPTWKVTLAHKTEGDKHPFNASFTDRLLKLQAGLQKLTAVALGGSGTDIPVLITEVTEEKSGMIQRLHRFSDWVVTVDRNAGVEYFDAPKDARDVYDTYVIDCVPERQDLDCVRLVTSTSNVSEVKYLLEDALQDMGLSSSKENCQFILEKLKALSGRLALRLASQPKSQGELIALAMFYERCRLQGDKPDSNWLSLTKGFLVPLDDVRDILLPSSPSKTVPSTEDEIEPDPNLRADFVYVTHSKKNELIFKFIEVKYRRNLISSGSQSTLDHIQNQTKKTRKRWHDGYFAETLKNSEKVLRGKRLARALMFYLDKAHRHELNDTKYESLRSAVEKLYGLKAKVHQQDLEYLGYIYCPEQFGQDQELINNGFTRIIRFGKQESTEYSNETLSTSSSVHSDKTSDEGVSLLSALPDSIALDELVQTTDGKVASTSISESTQTSKYEPLAASIHLGEGQISGDSVDWMVNIKSNPHLMIVGQPGTGKTTCIINLCQQLTSAGIIPIIFSYHEDIEQKLASKVDDLQLRDLENGLGFNPLQLVSSGRTNWLDNVGMLRDIFSSIYPDFGDMQNSAIRDSIKQSYSEKGFGDSSVAQDNLEIPSFSRFYDILKLQQKLPKGIRERLDELSDYGFFKSTGLESSLLELKKPAILRLHTIQNAVVQNALSSFVLLNLYQNMFLRGTQNRLTHAIIFDEAHRASRLKLIPTMAKECRKYGISLIVASQAAKDFPSTLYEAISNYLIFRVVDADAVALTKTILNSVDAPRYANRLKQLENYTGLFVAGGGKPGIIDLAP